MSPYNSGLAKVLVIGLDAAEPELIEKGCRDGSLPNLARLLSRSVYGRVVNPPALEPGSVWPTFHTGAPPGQQPQFDGVRHFDPITYEFANYTRDQLPVDPLWRRLSKAGRRSCVIDAPYTLLDPDIDGAMILDWGAHVPARGGNRMSFVTHPPELRQEIIDLVGEDPAGGVMCDDRSKENIAELRTFHEVYMGRVRKKAELSIRFLEKGGWDYFETVFCDLHCIGHHLWHAHDPAHPLHTPELAEELGDAVWQAYRAVDRAVGELTSRVGENTLTVVYCSHGMAPQVTATGLLDRLLYSLETGEKGRPRRGLLQTAKRLWRAVPADLRVKAWPVKRYFHGALTDEIFLGRRADRRFFEVYANNRTGGVRLNLRGREAHGQVAPEDAEVLLEELAADLAQVRNEETEEPLAKEVLRTRDLYPGPYADALPDLLVVWNSNHPIRIVTSPKIGSWRQDNWGRTGDHTPQGLFLATGCGISPGELECPVRVTDFARSFSDFLGVDSTGLAGGVLFRSASKEA